MIERKIKQLQMIPEEERTPEEYYKLGILLSFFEGGNIRKPNFDDIADMMNMIKALHQSTELVMEELYEFMDTLPSISIENTNDDE